MEEDDIRAQLTLEIYARVARDKEEAHARLKAAFCVGGWGFRWWELVVGGHE